MLRGTIRTWHVDMKSRSEQSDGVRSPFDVSKQGNTSSPYSAEKSGSHVSKQLEPCDARSAVVRPFVVGTVASGAQRMVERSLLTRSTFDQVG